MNFRILLSIIYVISTSYISAPTQAWAAAGQEGTMCRQASEKALNHCEKVKSGAIAAGQGINVIGQQAAQGSGIENQGEILNQGSRANSQNIQQTSNACLEAQNHCRTTCEKKMGEFNSNKSKPPYVDAVTKAPTPKVPEQEKEFKLGEQICGESLAEVLANLHQEKGASDKTAQGAGDTRDAAELDPIKEGPAEGGGGGMSPMMAGLLGAALGAGAAMLMNKKKEDKKKKEDEKVEDPVAEDGTVICTAEGAEIYSDCNEHFAAKCAADSNAAGCASFSSRYCTGSGSGAVANSGASTPATSNSGIIIASAADKNINGEGVGSQFCFSVQATAFCSTSGRETCPSCLQLQTNKASACASNPVLCMAQNNPTDINAAKNNCPSDPMFSNPEYMAGGGSRVGDTSGLNAPILPGQFAASGDSTTLGASSEIAGNSVIGSGGSNSAPSDAAGSGSGSASGSNSAGSYSGSEFAQGGATPDPILPGGAQIASLSSRAPTSVGGVMGPSLFSMSSAMIEVRCKQGQLAHCSR